MRTFGHLSDIVGLIEFHILCKFLSLLFNNVSVDTTCEIAFCTGGAIDLCAIMRPWNLGVSFLEYFIMVLSWALTGKQDSTYISTSNVPDNTQAFFLRHYLYVLWYTSISQLYKGLIILFLLLLVQQGLSHSLFTLQRKGGWAVL